MVELKDKIASTVSIDAEAIERITSMFEQRMVKKGNHVLRKGQICNQYYFVQHGCLRFYLKQEIEITGWLAFENDFFTELASLKKQQPTQFYLQAIEDTRLLTISRIQMEALYKQFPQWQVFGRQLWENAFLKVIDGIIAYQTQTAEARYLRLLEQTDAVQRIPLKYLASFLGVTPTSLSRIRRSMAK